MKPALVFLGLLFIGSCVCGCQRGTAPLLSQAAPESYIGFDPWSKRLEVHNSKDCDLSVAEAVVSKGADGTYSMTVRDLKLIDTASSVRAANVAQIEAGGVAMKQTLDGFAGIAGQFIGIAAAIGHGAGKSGADISAIQPIIDAAAALRVPGPAPPSPLPSPIIPPPEERQP